VGFDLSTVGKIGADPEVYRYFLSHLLDHGELSLAHVRALLDSALAEFVPLGDLVALAKTRGDAHQVDGRLVLTAGAVARKEVTGSVDSIILSDPTYRAYLTGLLAGSSAHPASPSLKAWHQRLFGGHQKPKALRHQLQQILLDRSLKSFPLAGDTGLVPTLTQRSFLDVWETPSLLICCPPTLVGLRGGLDQVNRLLRMARQGQDTVGLPHLADRPVHFHGGLLHPGEVPPKNVPDTLTLRLRVLMNCPTLTLITALLLGQRMAPVGPSLTLSAGRWVVMLGTKTLGDLHTLLDAFARSRHWIPATRSQRARPESECIDVLTDLAIATPITDGVVLSERFFATLRTDVEEMEVHRKLRPLADVFTAWLHRLDPAGTPLGR
jgi:hypothetical protein